MSFWSKNRFGQEHIIIAIKDKKNNGFPYGYVDIKGKVYKLEVNRANKDGVEYWVNLTETTLKSNRRY